MRRKRSIWYQPDHKQKASGVQLPEVHDSRKRLDPHKIPEKQPQPIMEIDVERKPRIGQGRAGVRRTALPPLDPRLGTSASKPIIISDEIGSKMPKSMIDILRSEMLPLYLVPHSRPPPKSPDNLSKKQQVVESSKIEIEENLPF